MSADSRFVHKIWQEEELSKMVKGGIPFPMLTDAGGRIGMAYGVYDEEAGVDIRGRFLIDPDGIIQAMEVLSPACGAEHRRVDPAGQGLPACARHRGSHPFGLAAGKTDLETRPGSGRKSLDGLEAGDGLLK